MFKIVKYKDLPSDILEKITEHIKTEFLPSEITKEYDFETPETCIYIEQDNEFVGFINIVLRKGFLGSDSVLIGGLCNLVVDKKHRGKRFDRQLMLKGLEYVFETKKVDFIVIYPYSERLTRFYARLGAKAKMYNLKAMSKNGWIELNYRAIIIKSVNLQTMTCETLETKEQVNLNGIPW